VAAWLDLVVVGGGPAGLATAIGARLAGLSVRLFDRRRPPIDKACGEGLMPDAVARLAALGIELQGAAVDGDAAGPAFPFRGIRYLDGELIATGCFPRAGGLGVRRLVLHQALARRAEEVGVELCWGVPVEGLETVGEPAVSGARAGRAGEVIETRAGEAFAVRAGGERVAARFIVGADGLHSRLRRWAGLELPVAAAGGSRSRSRRWGERAAPISGAASGPLFSPAGPVGAEARHEPSGEAPAVSARRSTLPPGARFGVRRHFACRPWSDFVEVYWGPGCEAYVTPVGAREVGVAMLWSGRKSDFDQLLSCWPDLAARLAGAAATSRDRGAGPLRQDVGGVQRGNLALAGDAAGYLDAITGEGIAVALHQAAALVDAILAGDLTRYAAAHWRIVRLPNLMTSLVLGLERRPALRRRAIRALAAEPALFSRLLGIHARALPPRQLGALGALRLLARFAVS
jgi:flavin-dependent dehydrogenase